MFDISKVDRATELFIFDIYIASLKIKKVADEFDNVQELLYDFRSWDSIIREFEIIGEASKYLLKDGLVSKEYQIVVDLRNYITHEYFGVNQDRIWNIVYNDLDIYIGIVIDLIRDIEPNLKVELIESFIEDNNYLDFVVKALEELKDAK
ncbi:MAG: HepT-like ribonuclease domain-containing protein [Campylobacterota bacterium]|nr:HepT-like ribonuclease domain-containing protein [Campylobacterota bacterium]